MKANWQAALSAIRRQVTSESFDRFFGRLSYAGFEAGVLRLSVDDGFLRDWIDDNYRSLLEAEVSAVAGAPVAIELRVAAPPAPPLAVVPEPPGTEGGSPDGGSAECLPLGGARELVAEFRATFAGVLQDCPTRLDGYRIRRTPARNRNDPASTHDPARPTIT